MTREFVKPKLQHLVNIISYVQYNIILNNICHINQIHVTHNAPGHFIESTTFIHDNKVAKKQVNAIHIRADFDELQVTDSTLNEGTNSRVNE